VARAWGAMAVTATTTPKGTKAAPSDRGAKCAGFVGRHAFVWESTSYTSTTLRDGAQHTPHAREEVVLDSSDRPRSARRADERCWCRIVIGMAEERIKADGVHASVGRRWAVGEEPLLETFVPAQCEVGLMHVRSPCPAWCGARP
jgi:hypothetical protein